MFWLDAGGCLAGCWLGLGSGCLLEAGGFVTVTGLGGWGSAGGGWNGLLEAGGLWEELAAGAAAWVTLGFCGGFCTTGSGGEPRKNRNIAYTA